MMELLCRCTYSHIFLSFGQNLIHYWNSVSEQIPLKPLNRSPFKFVVMTDILFLFIFFFCRKLCSFLNYWNSLSSQLLYIFLTELPESLSLWRTYSVYMHVCKEILIQFMGRIISLWALFKFVQNYIYMYHWNSLSAQLPLKRSNSISYPCKSIIKIYILCIFIGNSYLILFLREHIY